MNVTADAAPTSRAMVAAAAPLALVTPDAGAGDVDVPQFPPSGAPHHPPTVGRGVSHCVDTIDSSHLLTRTVTFSDGGADAHSHSFTYQVATGEREAIEDRIDRFLFEHVLGD